MDKKDLIWEDLNFDEPEITEEMRETWRNFVYTFGDIPITLGEIVEKNRKGISDRIKEIRRIAKKNIEYIETYPSEEIRNKLLKMYKATQYLYASKDSFSLDIKRENLLLGQRTGKFAADANLTFENRSGEKFTAFGIAITSTCWWVIERVDKPGTYLTFEEFQQWVKGTLRATVRRKAIEFCEE